MALTKLRPKVLSKLVSKVAGINGGYAPSANSLLYWDFRNTPDSVASTEINSNIECVTEASTSTRYIFQDTGSTYLAVPASTPAYNRGVGLWSEDASTNLVTNSLAGAAGIGLDSSSDATIAGLAGKSIVNDTSTGQHLSVHTISGATAATEGTISVRAKYEGTQYILLAASNGVSTEYIAGVFDLVNGTVSDSLGTLATVSGTSIKALGTDEYEISVTGTANTAAFANFLVGATPNSTVAASLSFTGAGEEVSYAVAQFEETYYYSSPIITSGSTVTRVACTTEADLAACGLTFPSNDYDVIVKGKLNKIPADGVIWGAINNSTPNDDYVAIEVDNSTTVIALYESGGVIATNISVTVPAISPGDTFTCTLNKRSTGNSTLTWNATSASQSTNWDLATDVDNIEFSAHGVLCVDDSMVDVELYSVEVIDAS